MKSGFKLSWNVWTIGIEWGKVYGKDTPGGDYYEWSYVTVRLLPLSYDWFGKQQEEKQYE